MRMKRPQLSISAPTIFGILQFLILPSLSAAPVLAAKSDDFVDSMGINIKLDRSEYDKNWAAIKPRLEELGIWHYRDGLANVDKSEVFRSRYQELFDETGMKGLFVWGPWENQGRAAVEAPGAAKKGLDYIGFISGQNEPDLFWPPDYDGNPSTGKWKEVLDYQNAMYDALKADLATRPIKVTSPPLSFYGNAKLLGNEGEVKGDFIAWHWYSGQGHPDKDEVATGMDRTKSGLGKPQAEASDFITTESGHNSWMTAKPGNTNNTAVSERTQMRYNLRILADQFRRGIKRTYLHQLMDLGTTNSFNNSWGIVSADPAKTPKPAFTAWKEMAGMFRERSWDKESKTFTLPRFTPGTLDYEISGNTNAVKHLLLQKSDGTFYLLVWVAAPSWKPSDDTDADVSREISIQFAGPRRVTRYQFDDRTGLKQERETASTGEGANWSFKASDSISILEVSGEVGEP